MQIMQLNQDQLLRVLQRDLSALLLRPGYTQISVSQAISVDQPIISRAKNGTLKRVTPRVRRLYVYVKNELRGVVVPDEVVAAAKAYVATGADPAVLVQSIDLLTASANRQRP
jgi:hypothetical protein